MQLDAGASSLMPAYTLDHLGALEAESIHIIRETAAQPAPHRPILRREVTPSS